MWERVEFVIEVKGTGYNDDFQWQLPWMGLFGDVFIILRITGPFVRTCAPLPPPGWRSKLLTIDHLLIDHWPFVDWLIDRWLVALCSTCYHSPHNGILRSRMPTYKPPLWIDYWPFADWLLTIDLFTVWIPCYCSWHKRYPPFAHPTHKPPLWMTAQGDWPLTIDYWQLTICWLINWPFADWLLTNDYCLNH